jgi:actin-related protein
MKLHTLKAPVIIRDGSSVVIEIGAAFIKCGIAGERVPRRVLANPTSLTQLLTGYFRFYSI